MVFLYRLRRILIFIALPITVLADVPLTTPSIDLTIFHINDLHSQLHAPKTDGFKLGGLARLAGLLDELRTQRKLSITLDAGDWSEGTWHYNLDTGANMLQLLGEMGFDATVVGNHDYMSGPDQLLETIIHAKPPFPILGANFDLSRYPRAKEFRQKISSSTIIEKEGLKIGLIGLTCWACLFDHFIDPITLQNPIQVARKLVKELRPKVDVLIVISHNYLPLNVLIARAVPEIDAVISGHLHKKTVKAELIESKGRKIPVVEAGEWGTFLGELTLSIDRKNKKISFVSNQLHPVFSWTPENPLIAKRIEEEDARLRKHYGGNFLEIVAEAEIDLDDRVAYHASLGDLVTKAYRNAVQADISFEVMPLIGNPIAQGPISVKDIHDVLPHLWSPMTQKEWTVKKVKIQGKEILKMLRLQHVPDAFPFERSGFIAFDNLEVTWKPKSGTIGIPKILNVLVAGKPLQQNREYSVALTEGTVTALQLLSKKFHLGIQLGEIQESGREAWQVILDYTKSLGKITEVNLSKNRKTFTTGPDPAVFHYGITLEKNGFSDGLAVEITNEGLREAYHIGVECKVGLPNLPAVYKTPFQIFTSIGSTLISVLPPGEKTTVHIPWNPSPGFWPVQCKLSAKQDSYSANSKTMKVFWVE